MLAAIWLGTGAGGSSNGDPTPAKPAPPLASVNGIPSKTRTDSDPLPRRQAQGANANSPEEEKLRKELRALYEGTLGTRTGTFDESIYLPDFKRFVEAEGIPGVKALSELYTELRLADNRRYHDLSLLLEKVLHDCYMSGSLASMADVIDALRAGDSTKNGEFSDALASDVMSSFALDQVTSVRIYQELCRTKPAQAYGHYFGTIAGHAGRWMGYDKALATLPHDPAFGEPAVADAFNGLIGAWVPRDAKACRDFIDALPKGAEKNRYLAALARGFAGNQKFAEAEAVLTELPADSKEAHEAREAIKRNKEWLQK